jgi:hypothetical protein
MMAYLEVDDDDDDDDNCFRKGLSFAAQGHWKLISR